MRRPVHNRNCHLPEGGPVLPRIEIKLWLLVGFMGVTLLALPSCESTTSPAVRVGTSTSQRGATTSEMADGVVVVGTGDPALDVPAVQAGVDQGGDVVLKGHFSFSGNPTVTVPLTGYPSATVLVSRSITITGARRESDDGEMTTIDGGSIPFFVNGPGASVSIKGLRFVKPTSDAVLVYAASGGGSSSCGVEGPEPFQHFGEGIGINTSGNTPSPTQPGKPENVAGTLRVADNDIDVNGGTAGGEHPPG